MIDFKRGVSAKDLRPFSVDDPLGQKSRKQASSVSRASDVPDLGGAAADMMGPARAVVRMVRVGCLLAAVVWVMGMAASAVSWVPELIDEFRPLIERVLSEMNGERDSSHEVRTEPDSAPVAPEPEPAPASPAPEPEPVPAEPVTDGAANPAPPDRAERSRVCERTVQCCLTVQGERARPMCERFRQMPMADPCIQAYEAFAQYGRQTGVPCQE